MKNNKKQIAVLFDIENISPETIFEDIFNKLNKDNYIAFPRKIIFNNVTQLKKTYLGKAIKDYHLDIVCTYSSIGKNIADFRLYMEVMDLLYNHPEIDGFLIVSADSDYSELVIRLSHESKYIIGVGPKGKCKDEYVNLFNEFIFIEDLNKKTEVEIVENKKEEKEEIQQSEITPVIDEKSSKKSNKKPIKDETYYNELELSLEEIRQEYLKKNISEIFYSNLVKELKEKSYYLEKFSKITFDDLSKAHYPIKYKEAKKKETAYISLIKKKEKKKSKVASK